MDEFQALLLKGKHRIPEAKVHMVTNRIAAEAERLHTAMMEDPILGQFSLSILDMPFSPQLCSEIRNQIADVFTMQFPPSLELGNREEA